ncbi:thiamine phosphate synthase [Thermomonas fusca]|uniref:Thiamine-phosphate synthase n=1 Tax=Thermomonas fusca TaxID=215690 RepID=A0A5R9PHE4_9GAMM|nr:thiamine phosphate synthase [Thermomonas fusca]TLX22822.1 thiamine phosphate synthase [Thermomonas fusca]
MNRLDPFYPVLDSAAWVQRLLPLGVRLVQLRIKDAAGEHLRAEIGNALAACRAHAAQLVVNDHWRLALDAGADFVHLGQEDLQDADLPMLRRRGVRLGISTHSEAELERALALAPDYIALGPVYPTTLKRMPWSPQGLPRLGEWKSQIGALPLVAIGGITLERAPGCFDAGADAVAMVSDIIRHPDPDARTTAWLQATRARA